MPSRIRWENLTLEEQATIVKMMAPELIRYRIDKKTVNDNWVPVLKDLPSDRVLVEWGALLKGSYRLCKHPKGKPQYAVATGFKNVGDS